MPARIFYIQLQIAFFFLLQSSMLLATEYTRDYSPHSGYVSSVQDEKNDDGIEIPFISPPAITTVPIKEKIFNSEISRELQNRYEDKFGRTEAERVYNSPNKDSYYEDLYMLNGTRQQADDQKRAFGNYMMARLVEYHTDRYLKSDPTARPIYEAKERLSKVRVEVQEVKIDAKYDLAGNTVDVMAKAPWFNTKLTVGTNQKFLSVTRQQTPSVGLEARYLMIEQKIAAIITKRMSQALSLSLTASKCTDDNPVCEKLLLGGLGLVF